MSDEIGITKAVAAARGVNLSNEQAQAVSEVSRMWPLNDRDLELARRFDAGELDQDQLTYLVPEAWRNRPDRSAVPAAKWRELFAASRFTHDFHIARRPRRAVVAFRGATEDNRDGLAWSHSIHQARYFARTRQDPHGPPASIWVCRIPTDRWFARYVEQSYENEITADVTGLRIEPADPLSPSMRVLVKFRDLTDPFAGVA